MWDGDPARQLDTRAIARGALLTRKRAETAIALLMRRRILVRTHLRGYTLAADIMDAQRVTPTDGMMTNGGAGCQASE